MEKKKRNLLKIAMQCLISEGYEALSMSKVAKMAGASKETLYRHFGDKRGLLSALIEYKSEDAQMFKPYATQYAGDLAGMLIAIGEDLLCFLQSDQAIAINRLVVASNERTEFAQLLTEKGQQPVTSHIYEQVQMFENSEVILAELNIFLALLIQDSQLNAILGRPTLAQTEIQQRAKHATQLFLLFIYRKGETQ